MGSVHLGKRVLANPRLLSMIAVLALGCESNDDCKLTLTCPADAAATSTSDTPNEDVGSDAAGLEAGLDSERGAGGSATVPAEGDDDADDGDGANEPAPGGAGGEPTEITDGGKRRVDASLDDPDENRTEPDAADGGGLVDASVMPTGDAGTKLDGAVDSGPAPAPFCTDAACTAPTPYCDEAMKQCAACSVVDAGGCDEDEPYCVLKDTMGALGCVACVSDDDCFNDEPICDPAGSCVDCSTHDDCTDSRFGPFCREFDGSCVECLSDDDCDVSRPVCFSTLTRGTCSACTSHEYCAERFPERPFCNPTFGGCMPCMEHSDCLNVNASRCVVTTWECTGCTDDAECAHIPGRPNCEGTVCVP